jgi:hypothetical protein
LLPLKDNIPTDRLPWVTITLIAANVIVCPLAVSPGGSLFSGPSPPPHSPAPRRRGLVS